MLGLHVYHYTREDSLQPMLFLLHYWPSRSMIFISSERTCAIFYRWSVATLAISRTI